MVVFQYGSIVLFNVREHEVDGYLKIVEKHASGLLPEMRKDGKNFKCIFIQNFFLFPFLFYFFKQISYTNLFLLELCHCYCWHF